MIYSNQFGLKYGSVRRVVLVICSDLYAEIQSRHNILYVIRFIHALHTVCPVLIDSFSLDTFVVL